MYPTSPDCVKGSCSHESHHGVYRHFCSSCFKHGRSLTHPEVKCSVKLSIKHQENAVPLRYDGLPPHGHAQHLQSPPGMDSVNNDNNLIKFNKIANTDMNCKNLDNSVNFTCNASVQLFDDNVFEFGISRVSVLAEHAGTCIQQCSKNNENNNVLAFGSCVRPAVEGDTNRSNKKSKCKDLYHESWLDKYNI